MHILRYGAESRLNVLRYAMNVLRCGAESRKPKKCIKIGDACIKIGNACIKIWNRVFSVLCDIFRHCEIFSQKIQKFLAGPPARINITPADSYYACRFFITRADIDMIYCYVKRLCNSLKKLIRMYKSGQKKQDINCTYTYKYYM